MRCTLAGKSITQVPVKEMQSLRGEHATWIRLIHIAQRLGSGSEEAEFTTHQWSGVTSEVASVSLTWL